MKTTLSRKRALLLTGFALCYFLFCSRTLCAAETRAVTVLSANNSMGVVNCRMQAYPLWRNDESARIFFGKIKKSCAPP